MSYLPCCDSSFLYGGGRRSDLHGKLAISFRNGRGKRAFFARHDLCFLFFFYGPVGLNLFPKKCLTTSKTVMCVKGRGGGGGGVVFRLRDQPGNH